MVNSRLEITSFEHAAPRKQCFCVASARHGDEADESNREKGGREEREGDRYKVVWWVTRKREKSAIIEVRRSSGCENGKPCEIGSHDLCT